MQSKISKILVPQISNLSNSIYLLSFIFIILAAISTLLLPENIVIFLILIVSVTIILFPLKLHVFQILLITVYFGVFLDTSYKIYYLIYYNTFFFVLIGYYYISFCLSEKTSKKVSPQHIFAFIFILLGIIAFISMYVNMRFDKRAILEVIRFFSLCPLFLIMFSFLKDVSVIKKIAATIIFVNLSITAYSYILLFDLGLQGFVLQGITAMHGYFEGFVNPNSMAMMICYSLPIIVAYLLFNKEKMIKNRYVYFCLVFIILIWLLWNSRSSYIYVFVSVVVLMGFHKKRKIFYSIIIFSGIAAILSLNYIPFAKDILRIESGLSLRESLWDSAINMFVQNPFFGTGPSSFSSIGYYYNESIIAKSIIGMGFGGGAHNLILQKMAELGFLSILIIIFCWFFMIYQFVKNHKMMRDSKYYYLYLAAFASIIGLIVRSAFESGDLIGGGQLISNFIPFFYFALILRLPEFRKANTED